MLTALRTGIRFRVAIALAAFAVLCFVAPPAVLAFGHGGSLVHCLTHADAADHDMAVTAKAHEHGPAVAPGVPADHHPGCCELFNLSVLMPAGEALLQPAWFGLAFAPLLNLGFLSPAADNPDPPPIALQV